MCMSQRPGIRTLPEASLSDGRQLSLSTLVDARDSITRYEDGHITLRRAPGRIDYGDVSDRKELRRGRLAGGRTSDGHYQESEREESLKRQFVILSCLGLSNEKM